jgi:hypothetical protein
MTPPFTFLTGKREYPAEALQHKDFSLPDYIFHRVICGEYQSRTGYITTTHQMSIPPHYQRERENGNFLSNRYGTTLFHLPFSVSSPGKLRGRPETDRRILVLSSLHQNRHCQFIAMLPFLPGSHNTLRHGTLPSLPHFLTYLRINHPCIRRLLHVHTTPF